MHPQRRSPTFKVLASQTGTTFTFPRSGYQAGREIERLKALKAQARTLPGNSPAGARPGGAALRDRAEAR